MSRRRRWLFALCSVLYPNRASAQCQVPPYTIGPFGSEGKAEKLITIAIRPVDLTRERLSCLAASLKERNKDKQVLTALIFTSDNAARRYTGPRFVEHDPAQRSSVRHLHAAYVFDLQRRLDYIEIIPLGTDGPGPYDMRFNLPLGLGAECPYSVGGRCLVTLDEVQYPVEAVTKGISAQVTIDATINADGTVGRMKVRTSPKIPETLKRSAVSNLRTWRFESASRSDQLHVTFSYVLDSAFASHGRMHAELKLPSDVIVRAAPLSR